MYEAYADETYYQEHYGGSMIPDGEQGRRLKLASRHVDALTYNRIVSRGISKLTEYQQDIIREVVCMQADFEYENADLLDTVLSGYSLNGVSVQFGATWNMHMENGVAMKADAYALLRQTGLCCRLLR